MTSVGHDEAQAAVDTVFGAGCAQVYDVQTRTVVREEELVWINGRRVQLEPEEAAALREAVSTGRVPSPTMLQRLLRHQDTTAAASQSQGSVAGESGGGQGYVEVGGTSVSPTPHQPGLRQRVVSASLQVNSRTSQRDTMVVAPGDSSLPPQAGVNSEVALSTPSLSSLAPAADAIARYTTHESHRSMSCLATTVDVEPASAREGAAHKAGQTASTPVRVVSNAQTSVHVESNVSNARLTDHQALASGNIESLEKNRIASLNGVDLNGPLSRSLSGENACCPKLFLQSSPKPDRQASAGTACSFVDPSNHSPLMHLRSSVSSVNSAFSSATSASSVSSRPNSGDHFRPEEVDAVVDQDSGGTRTLADPSYRHHVSPPLANIGETEDYDGSTGRGRASLPDCCQHTRAPAVTARVTRLLANNDSGYMNSGESEQDEDDEAVPDTDEGFIPYADDSCASAEADNPIGSSSSDDETGRVRPSIFSLAAFDKDDVKATTTNIINNNSGGDYINRMRNHSELSDDVNDSSIYPPCARTDAASVPLSGVPGCALDTAGMSSAYSRNSDAQGGVTANASEVTGSLTRCQVSGQTPVSATAATTGIDSLGDNCLALSDRPAAGLTKRLQFCDGDQRSAPLDDLIHHLTPSLSHYPDRAFVFAFLLSSRLYIRPEELLKRVTSSISLDTVVTLSSKANQHSQAKVACGVLHLVAEWSDTFPYDFRDPAMMSQLRLVAQNCIRANPELQQEVRTVLQSLLEKLQCLETFERSLERISSQAARALNSTEPSDITEICSSPSQLARQLTLIELERLSFIGPEEFVQAFAKESGYVDVNFKAAKTTRNLENYVDWFNRFSYLIATEVCSHNRKRHRARLLLYWCSVARECFNLGNFNSLMAIIAGLNLSPVARLKKTWARVDTTQLSVLEQQMSPSSNYLSYRRTLQAAVWRSCASSAQQQQQQQQQQLQQQGDRQAQSVIIPFFSLLIKDLYFLNEGCANRVHGDWINLDKVWQLARQVTEFISWKQAVCELSAEPPVARYLLTARVFDELTLRRASYECEPPEKSFDKSRLKLLRAEL